MFAGIHDAEVVAYSFDSRTAELVLSLAPGHGSAAAEFQLIFRGVAAHQFPYPQLPSIVLDLAETSAATLVAREWANLAAGFRQCGWPGPWAVSAEAATAFCISCGLRGYDLEQSFGMYGWILARSVERVSSAGAFQPFVSASGR
ncbi:hypothetical protein P8609_14755 [Lysobacter sp. UC]|uniref:Uncharacterized protein n=1 Tax=Lysobacter arvi TaxID=3038776 RepID=A0ABU1CGY7_9GAMM|nr:hypothetical protein [Lysobacter arvi]